MTKAVEQLRSGLVVGHAGLRSVGTSDPVGKDVHDGDTVAVLAAGDVGVRFLGVDAPEVTAPLPGTQAPLVALDDPRWEQALAAAFAPGAQPLGPAADPALVAHLEARAVVGEAVNHARLAAAARIALVDMVSKDMAALGVDAAGFRFFLAFAADVMDRYGRLLGYVKPDQPHVPAEQRLGSYNERLLAAGWASPYFIWPNTSPWRAAPAIVDAVPAPGTAAQAAAADPALVAARASVKAARRLRDRAVRSRPAVAAAGLRAADAGAAPAPGPVAGRPRRGWRHLDPAAVLPARPAARGPAVHPGRVRAAVGGEGLAAPPRTLTTTRARAAPR